MPYDYTSSIHENMVINSDGSIELKDFKMNASVGSQESEVQGSQSSQPELQRESQPQSESENLNLVPEKDNKQPPKRTKTKEELIAEVNKLRTGIFFDKTTIIVELIKNIKERNQQLTIRSGWDFNELHPFLADFDWLIYMDINSPYIDKIENIPPRLKRLRIINSNIREIPKGVLPEGIVNISFKGNKISEVDGDAFPSTLKILDLTDNLIKNIYNLKKSKLTNLSLSNNLLPEVPPLPDTLDFLDLSSNQLTQFPTQLPNSLDHLKIGHNRIIRFERLPDDLKILSAPSNNLKYLTELPKTLTDIDVSNNEIIFMPNLPPNLAKLNLTGNNLSLFRFDNQTPQTLKILLLSKNKFSPHELSTLYTKYRYLDRYESDYQPSNEDKTSSPQKNNHVTIHIDHSAIPNNKNQNTNNFRYAYRPYCDPYIIVHRGEKTV